MTLSDDEIRQILQDKTEVKELNTSSPYLIVFQRISNEISNEESYELQSLAEYLRKILPKAVVVYTRGDMGFTVYSIDNREPHLGQCQYCHEVHDLRLICIDRLKALEREALNEFLAGFMKGLA